MAAACCYGRPSFACHPSASHPFTAPLPRRPHHSHPLRWIHRLRYGDIVPITTAGRVTIMLMMATALLTIPRMMNKLVFVLSKQST